MVTLGIGGNEWLGGSNKTHGGFQFPIVGATVGLSYGQDKVVRIGFQKYGKLVLLKSKGTLESGVRIATTNAKGEREFMDDKTRAAEMQRIEAAIRSDCS